MSHTRFSTSKGYFEIRRIDEAGVETAWVSGSYISYQAKWHVVESRHVAAVGMFVTRREAIRYALACLQRDMLLDGTLPAVSPEDRVGVSSSRLGSWFAKP